MLFSKKHMPKPPEDYEKYLSRKTLDEKIAEIERLREALRYYADKKQEDWINISGADDGVVARAALGKGK